MTTGSLGRSRRSVAVVAMASTTFCDSGSTTSPKMVCLRFRCGVLPTVMKNCEPLVPGPRVRHRQQVGLVELQLGVELVAELVARAAAAGAGGVAALDHEAVDHAVEHGAVVERSGRAARRVLGAVVLGALRQIRRSWRRSWGRDFRTVRS